MSALVYGSKEYFERLRSGSHAPANNWERQCKACHLWYESLVYLSGSRCTACCMEVFMPDTQADEGRGE